MMLAYAAQNPRPAGRAGSPKALLLIVAGHAALIAAVMAAKMDVIRIVPSEPPIVINVPPEPKPPEPEVKPQAEPQLPQPVFIDHVKPLVLVEPHVPTPPVQDGPIVQQQQLPPLGGDPVALDPPRHVPVRVGVRFATPPGAVKPPYPNDKLRLEQEATLRLKLTIDTRGRVIAVEPVGPADPSFLEAARRHILKAWRYKPATEDGVAVPMTTVINLSFRLEEA